MDEVALPQRSTRAETRRRALAKERTRYHYIASEDNPIAPIAKAETLPSSELYQLDWALPYLPQLLRSVVDAQAQRLWNGVRALVAPRDKMQGFERLFNPLFKLPPPKQLADWSSDGAFARRWLDGPNPLILSRVRSADELRARMPISDEEFRRALPGSRSLADDLAEARLFLADYQLLQQSLLPASEAGRDSRWRDKYLPAPVVLLCERPGVEPLCDLVPVAIQIDQPGASAPNPIYLRETGSRWTLAKLFVDVADFNLQGLSSHIYRHHFVLEPLVLATRRQLSREHPIHVLLEPHIRFSMVVTHAAFGTLRKPGGLFDSMYAGELAESRAILVNSYQRWTMRDLALEADLEARDVGAAPHDYPWRDDARLWQAAIDRFVSDYVRLFYRRDSDVVQDWEMQAWARELQSSDGGGLRGLFVGDCLQTVDELARVLGQFLFTAGPGHAAVHYPQADYFTYVPMAPGAAYKPPPQLDQPVDEQRLRDTLPPFRRGALQFQTNQIACYRYDCFGDYRAYALGRLEAARPLVARLQTDLADIEALISVRNQSRTRPYLYLLPSLVPNSNNI